MCKHSDKNQWLTSFNMHIFKKLQTRNSLRGFVPPSVCWSICQHELGWIPMPTRPQQYLWPRITCWSSFRSVAQFEKKKLFNLAHLFFTILVLMINCANLNSMMHMNKAGYTANTSRGRVGRGGNACFPTFRLERDGPTNQPTNRPTNRRTDGRTKPLIESLVRD